MKEKFKVAICIPAFSTAINISECIESIYACNADEFDIDILLYNNSQNQEIIDLCKKLSYKNDSIYLFDHRSNRGCSKTWNDALDHVFFTNRNKYSAFIITNDDVIFQEDSVIKLVNCIMDNPDCPVILANGYSIFGYNKIAYEKIGYFDENIYPAYFEDSDFSNRLHKLGFHEPVCEIKHIHKHSQSIPSNNLRAEFDNIHMPRTQNYSQKKWNNPHKHFGMPIRYSRPFNAELGYKIDYKNRKAPYGSFDVINFPPNSFNMFQELKNTGSDINEHLQTIFEYSKNCRIGLELGCGYGRSSFAFLMALQKLYSVDINHLQTAYELLNPYFGEKFVRIEGSSLEFTDYEDVDVMLVDSWHTYGHVKKELEIHAQNIKKYIMFHDTVSFGTLGEDGIKGVNDAINEFLAEHPEWVKVYEAFNNNGFLIIEKQ